MVFAELLFIGVVKVGDPPCAKWGNSIRVIEEGTLFKKADGLGFWRLFSKTIELSRLSACAQLRKSKSSKVKGSESTTKEQKWRPGRTVKFVLDDDESSDPNNN